MWKIAPDRASSPFMGAHHRELVPNMFASNYWAHIQQLSMRQGFHYGLASVIKSSRGNTVSVYAGNVRHG